ncbi:hypothetical protein EIP91_005288 [Steccherinum ochraceum]|uniref:F-box domain-containing protein n=1 Tax=Steccherinum ochraceum TaxID=92696 RepID=A0A4R0R7P3_9APHY|nr:hypothetical protein EIP91_005288 [Steccherinum ochraceum]
MNMAPPRQQHMYEDISVSEVEACIASLNYTEDYQESLLKKEAREITIRLLALHAVLNRRTTVNRLPGEILVEIFNFCRQISLPSYCWFRVSHVCRRWRQVALDSPFLWTCIGLHNAGYVLACIERSRGMPLSVTFRPSKQPPDGRFADILAPEMSRITSLDVETPGCMLENMLEPDAHTRPLPFDKVTSLRIAESQSTSQSSLPTVGGPSYFDSFLASLPCHPHTLKLHGLKIPRNPALFSTHLVVLQLSQPHGTHDLSVSELLYALQRCPSLEDLKLLYTGPSFGAVAGPTPELELPKLKSLKVLQRQYIPTVDTLARVLVLPFDTRVHIEVDCYAWAEQGDNTMSMQYYLQRCARSIAGASQLSRLDLRATKGCFEVMGFRNASSELHFLFRFFNLSGNKSSLSRTDLETIIGDVFASCPVQNFCLA